MPAPKPLFPVSKPVVAMIHVGALPGTPAGRRPLREIEAQALKEAARTTMSDVLMTLMIADSRAALI